MRQDDQGLVRFNLLDTDGTVLLSSKGFDSLDGARQGLQRALDLLGDVEVIDQVEGDQPVRSSSSVAEGGGTA